MLPRISRCWNDDRIKFEENDKIEWIFFFSLAWFDIPKEIREKIQDTSCNEI
jgi:hypothetical protein